MTTNTATPILRAAAKREHALRGGGRSCPCCCSYGSTKGGARIRQAVRQQQRRIEDRAWRAEAAS